MATAFLVGMLNTLLVAAIGIFFATLLGFIVGIARLSRNFIISRLAVIYVETLRNVPLLLQLVFWYFAVLKSMPGRATKLCVLRRHRHQPTRAVSAAFRDRRPVHLGLDRTRCRHRGCVLCQALGAPAPRSHGAPLPRLLDIARCILVALPVLVALITGTQISVDLPVLQGFNFQGGIGLPPELVALCLGSHPLHGHLHLPRSCAPASSRSAGDRPRPPRRSVYKDGDRLRLVIIPQAMRVIIPPLASQYLNLTKNSSLAIAIGYPGPRQRVHEHHAQPDRAARSRSFSSPCWSI